MPSNTSKRPSAARKSERVSDTGSADDGGALVLGRRYLRPGARGCVLQVAEEFPIGGEHEEIAVLAERALIGLEAAVEGVELGVARIGVRVGLGGRRIALTAGAQRIALGVRQDHR